LLGFGDPENWSCEMSGEIIELADWAGTDAGVRIPSVILGFGIEGSFEGA